MTFKIDFCNPEKPISIVILFLSEFSLKRKFILLILNNTINTII